MKIDRLNFSYYSDLCLCFYVLDVRNHLPACVILTKQCFHRFTFLLWDCDGTLKKIRSSLHLHPSLGDGNRT